MIVRRSGVDWWSRRAELLKRFVGQEVLCLTENLYPPDASLRRKLHHHLTSLCLMMLFCFYRDAASENNLWASSVKGEQCWGWKRPRVALADWNANGQQHKERLKVVFRPAGNFSHISFAFFFFIKKKKKKNHFDLRFQWNCLHLFSSQAVQ